MLYIEVTTQDNGIQSALLFILYSSTSHLINYISFGQPVSNTVLFLPVTNNKIRMDLLSLATFLLLVLMPSFSYSSQYVGGYNIIPHRKTLPKHQEENYTSYAVIFVDAGSSGTRVHVFHFDQNLNLIRIGNNDFEFRDKIEPGLSAYAEKPEEGAESLIPLVKEAENIIPEDLHSNTPVRLEATAGLRLLDADASERILQAVRDMFRNRSTLNVQDDAVAVIDGTQEGSYIWVAVNYLVGNLGKKYTKTGGVIDLGGASVQMVYAVSKNTANNAPKVPQGQDPYIKKLVLKGNKYNLYVHSYLRYGSDAARAEILNVTYNSANPCLLSGFDGTYTYSGKDYKAFAPKTHGSSFDECRKIVVEALRVNDPCSHPICTFGGIWSGGGGSGQNNLYVASSFSYLATETGIADPKKPNSKAYPVDYKKAAKVACKTSFEDVKSAYPLVRQQRLPYVCMDLTYQYTLLVHGFGLDPWQEITVTKQIEYEGASLDAAWPLGSAIEAISSLPKFERFMYFI